MLVLCCENKTHPWNQAELSHCVGKISCSKTHLIYGLDNKLNDSRQWNHSFSLQNSHLISDLFQRHPIIWPATIPLRSLHFAASSLYWTISENRMSTPCFLNNTLLNAYLDQMDSRCREGATRDMYWAKMSRETRSCYHWQKKTGSRLWMPSQKLTFEVIWDR